VKSRRVRADDQTRAPIPGLLVRITEPDAEIPYDPDSNVIDFLMTNVVLDLPESEHRPPFKLQVYDADKKLIAEGQIRISGRNLYQEVVVLASWFCADTLQVHNRRRVWQELRENHVRGKRQRMVTFGVIRRNIL
jgi:hypothetical protein